MNKDLKPTRDYLLWKYGKDFCKAIYDNPRDVSHSFYRAVFDGYEW